MMVVIVLYLLPLNDPFVGQMMLTKAIRVAVFVCWYFHACGDFVAIDGCGCGGGAGNVGGCGE